jgi:SAM-dependent methyltransferase
MKRRTFGPLLDRCALEPGASILDVGCATGSFLRFAADRGLKTYGVDLNEQAILEAAALVPDGSFYAGTLADDPFPGRSFDAIAMNDFIEHVREPRAELSFAAARLARGGRLAISTPRADSLTRRLLKGAWPQYREEHLTYFSRDGLRTLLEECGLRVVVSAITRKAVTLGYVYGQAKAYPAPVITPVTAGAYKALPFARNTTMRLPFGEMTVIAVRA